jgi:hypothetical protein
MQHSAFGDSPVNAIPPSLRLTASQSQQIPRDIAQGVNMCGIIRAEYGMWPC